VADGFSISGIIACWTAVGRVNPNFRQVDTSGGQRPRSAKVVVSELVDVLALPLVVGDGEDEEEAGMDPVSLCPLLSSDTGRRGRLRFLVAPFRKRLDIFVIRLF